METPNEFDTGFRVEDCAAGFAQFGGSFEPPAPPNPIDALRECKPSRELLLLVAKEATRAASDGNLNDAIALTIFGLCLREVIT